MLPDFAESHFEVARIVVRVELEVPFERSGDIVRERNIHIQSEHSAILVDFASGNRKPINTAVHERSDRANVRTAEIVNPAAVE